MFYWIGRTLFLVLFRTVYRLKVTGKGHIPSGGGFLIACNHSSYIDPPLVGSSISRAVNFMAKKELFDIPVLGWLIARTKAFPVNRERITPSTIKRAVSIVNSGEALLIFPEGTRRSEEVQLGISFFAHKLGVPVVPCRIKGNSDITEFKRLHFIISEPVRFPVPPGSRAGTDTYRTFAGQLMERIRSL